MPKIVINPHASKDGWVSSSVKKPTLYDLVKIKEENNSPTQYGWWAGIGWEGYQITHGKHFKYWKSSKQ